MIATKNSWLSVQNPPNVLGNGDSADRENDGKNYISKDASQEHHAEKGRGSTVGRPGRQTNYFTGS
jgi:hypothetical protein